MAKSKTSGIAAMLCGALVFIAAYLEKVPLTEWVFGNPAGIAAITAAIVSFVLLWYLLLKRKSNGFRLLAGFQVTMILFATTFPHFPEIVILKNGTFLSLLEHRGQDRTIAALAIALLLGSVFILPALFYLIYSFQQKPKEENS